MELYSHEDMLNKVLGEKGTLERDGYEAKMNSFLMGSHYKSACFETPYTRIAWRNDRVKRAQVSRIENGHNLTFSTIARAFKAMGIGASFEIAGFGKVDLW